MENTAPCGARAGPGACEFVRMKACGAAKNASRSFHSEYIVVMPDGRVERAQLLNSCHQYSSQTEHDWSADCLPVMQVRGDEAAAGRGRPRWGDGERI